MNFYSVNLLVFGDLFGKVISLTLTNVKGILSKEENISNATETQCRQGE